VTPPMLPIKDQIIYCPLVLWIN